MGWPYVKYRARHTPLMRNTLRCITETVRAWQEEEHDAEGGHSDVTANSITLNQTSALDPLSGAITLYDEFNREIALDGSSSRSESIQALRVRVSDDLITTDGSLAGGGGTVALLGVLQPTGPGNAFGPGLFLRKPATPVTPLDGWILSVSETDSLLTGTSMLAITNTREGHIVLLLRPVGAETAVSSYVLSPKSAYAIGATVDLGRDSNGERFQNIYAENIDANTSLVAAALSADTITALTAFILGAATTAGIRFDLESGLLAIREGDDSGYATVLADAFVGNTILGSSSVIVTANDTTGTRLDTESGSLAVREGDDSTYNDVRARFYTEADVNTGSLRNAAMGYWQQYTHSAGTFTGSGSMTWGVDDGDEGFFYSRVGDSLHFQGIVVSSDVGGTASNGLRITLPASLVGATNATQRGPILYQDAGGATAYGFWQVLSGSTFVECFKLDESNWTLTTGDNTYVQLMNTTIFVNP